MGKTQTEFYVAALSILSTRGEMAGNDLRLAINERNKTKTGIGTFYTRMDIIEREGSVTSQQRPAPTEEARKTRGNNLVRYFQITDSGLRKRIDLAEASRPKTELASGLPEPVPA